MEYFSRTVNKSVGAGRNTLMSISDGLGLSIFCRKMEKARPMSEEMDGKNVYFRPESALPPLMLYSQQKKLPALNKENCEEHPRSNLAQNSNVPRSQEDYITQVSEETEGRLTKKLSQEFSRTENRIVGALARFDDFLINPLLQGHSGTTPETSRNMFSINQGTNEDDSMSNLHPEAGLLISGREDRHDMATGIQREFTQAKVMVTGVHEEVCSAPLAHLQERRKRSALQVNPSFAAKTPLRRLRQSKFCWHFSS